MTLQERFGVLRLRTGFSDDRIIYESVLVSEPMRFAIPKKYRNLKVPIFIFGFGVVSHV